MNLCVRFFTDFTFIIVNIWRSKQTRLKKVVHKTDIENSLTTSPTKQHHKMMMIKNVCSSPPRRGVSAPAWLDYLWGLQAPNLYWTLPLCLCALSTWCLVLVLGATFYCTLCLFDWWAWCRPLYLLGEQCACFFYFGRLCFARWQTPLRCVLCAVCLVQGPHCATFSSK